MLAFHLVIAYIGERELRVGAAMLYLELKDESYPADIILDPPF
jgi:hypothetical protein